MNAAPIVYLGPSLPRAEAMALAAGDYRPPIRRGDLGEVPAESTIVILDGEFAQSLSVSPKEILSALRRGCRVLGAASMGALRAAELDGLGMEGVGWIFESYRSGRVLGDDEVALAYSPFDLSPLTVPLINVRYWLLLLRRKGEVEAREVPSILRAARRIFYAERTVERLYERLGDTLGEARFARSLVATGGVIPDIKAQDAREALRKVCSSVHPNRETATSRR
jgi:TfuA protein